MELCHWSRLEWLFVFMERETRHFAIWQCDKLEIINQNQTPIKGQCLFTAICGGMAKQVDGGWRYIRIWFCTGLLKMTVAVQLSSGNSAPNAGNNHHLTITFEGGMHSCKRQGACVSRNWRYESEPPLKPSPLTCYKQFGTNSIIVLMFVEPQRVHI